MGHTTSTTRRTDPSVAARIHVALPTLVPSDAKVARVILANPDRVLHCTITDLAAAGTSASTVVRACQRLGFRGFRDLGAMASRMAHIGVLDALYLAVALHDRGRATAALNATAEVTAIHQASSN